MSGSFHFVCYRLFQWGQRESGSNDACCLACLFNRFFLASLFLLPFPLPAGLIPVRPYTGTFFLFIVLFRPCNSYLFRFSTYAVLLADFLIYLLASLPQNSPTMSFVLFSLFSLVFIVWLVLLRSRSVRY